MRSWGLDLLPSTPFFFFAQQHPFLLALLVYLEKSFIFGPVCIFKNPPRHKKKRFFYLKQKIKITFLCFIISDIRKRSPGNLNLYYFLFFKLKQKINHFFVKGSLSFWYKILYESKLWLPRLLFRLHSEKVKKKIFFFCFDFSSNFYVCI